MIYLALYDLTRHEVDAIETYKGKTDAEDNARKEAFEIETRLRSEPWTVYSSKEKPFSWDEVEPKEPTNEE